MIQICEFPFRPRTENEVRRIATRVILAKITAKERGVVRQVLGATFVAPKLIVPRADGNGSMANEFRVQFVRIARGRLDPDENLPGTFKATKDELAAWLGLDDADDRIAWSYDQERGPAGFYGVRISVHDLGPGKDIKRVLAGFVAGVHGKAPNGPRAKVRRAPVPQARGLRYTPQEPLPFRYPPTRGPR